MRDRLEARLPFVLQLFLRRALVAVVGAGVRVTARAVTFKQRLLAAAVRRGLNFEQAWHMPARAAGANHDESLRACGAREFLFLMEGASWAHRSCPERDATAGQRLVTSIVILVHNHVEYTFQCLRSLLREIDFSQHELIVVDNGSQDETPRLLAHFSPFARVITNPSNRGFGEGCNQGAAIARGRYLVFLNNDTIVLPGWLTHLVETAEADANIGAVGSLLVFPSGVIQEAGAIVTRDGGVIHVGRNHLQDDRRYAFARDVDYCSASSFLIRKDLFDRVGGFDPRFAPAYYEDVDLCFNVRALGYRVVYQPASRIVHFENVTAGRDPNVGYKRFETINRPKFCDKWRDVLLRDHSDPRAALLRDSADRKRAPVVLVFDERVPASDRDLRNARTLASLNALARWSRPVFLPMISPTDRACIRLLGKHGIEVASVVEYSRILRERDVYAAVFNGESVAPSLMRAIRRAHPQVRVVSDLADCPTLRSEYDTSAGLARRAV